MRAVARAAAVLSLVVPLLAVGATPCVACSCEQRTPGAVIDEADVVFVGEVIGDRLVGEGTAQRFRVDRVYAGAVPPEVEIYAAIGPGMVSSCAVLFAPGDRVALALSRVDGPYVYQTSSCSLISAETVERIAGEGYAPDPSATFPRIPAANEGQEPPWRLPWWAVLSLGALLAAGLIWASFLRNRRAAAAEPATGPLPEDVPPPDGHAG